MSTGQYKPHSKLHGSLTHGSLTTGVPRQREKVAKSTHKYENAIRKVDVKLSVRGGDRGAGPKEHTAEVTIFTLRNGVVGIYSSILPILRTPVHTRL